MSTGIEWTDATWSPVVGCSRVSPGCEHCYAAAMDKRLRGGAGEEWRPWTAANAEYNVRLHPERLDAPLRWRKPRRVFVKSDLFHEAVPDGFIVRVLMTMLRTPQHQYQILTKRPSRMRDFFTRWADLSGEAWEPKLVRGPAATRETHPSGRGQLFAAYLESLASAEPRGEPPPGAAWPTFDWMEGPRWWPTSPPWNVWLGVSVEDQRRADERIPVLLETPAAVRFISAEPLLEEVDISLWTTPNNLIQRPGLDWVIVGGESGPGARPCDLDWIRALVDQCRDASVPVFVKQLGAKPWPTIRLRDRKGGDPAEWPEDLRVREWPR